MTEPIVHRWQWRILHAPKEELHPTTRHLLLTLSVRMNPDGSNCYPSIRRLATETGLSGRTICTRLEEAERGGWIHRRQRGEGQAWKGYVYEPRFPQRVEGGSAPRPPNVLKEVQHDGAEGVEALSGKVLKEVQSTRSVYPTRELLPPPIPSPREGSDAESYTDSPGPAPSEGEALRADAEASTAPPSSPPSENGRPSAGRFPSHELVELVHAEWYRSDRPPVDAPPAWTEGADMRFLKPLWRDLGDEGTRLFVRGVRCLAEAQDTDLRVRDGDSQEARSLLPAEGFTGALVQVWLKQNPGLLHEAIGAARKADELNHARDGPSRTGGEGDRLRQLAEEAIGAK